LIESPSHCGRGDSFGPLDAGTRVEFGLFLTLAIGSESRNSIIVALIAFEYPVESGSS
jgi:hypothetical protein